MVGAFIPLKEVKELDGNIYVSMEYCNKEKEIRDKKIEELKNENSRIRAKLQKNKMFLELIIKDLKEL